MKQLNLRSGDTLGMFSEWKNIKNLEKKREFAVVTSDYPKDDINPEKKWQAIAWLALALILILGFHTGVGIGLITGALGMIISGVIDIDDAYHAVSWKTIFLLAGLIPFGFAMQTTGTANWVAYEIFHYFGGLPSWVLLLGLSILAALFSLVMSNVGATVVLVPIAINLAISIHADPRLFAIVTAVATSNSFLIPTHQVNALITGPGGYHTKDFIKIGTMVSILYVVVMLPAAYLFIG